MALQVWLPLNESTSNYGLKDVTITENGTVKYDSGILGGKAFSAGQGSVAIELNPSSDKLSVMFWFKGAGTNANAVIAQIGDTKIVYNDSNYSASGDGLIADNTQLFTVAQNAVWNHIAMIFDGTNIKFYLNGALANTVAQAKSISEGFGTNKNIIIGADSDNANNWIGKISDFKVYDNTVSLALINHIAKGLVLNYTFNHLGYGSHNILVNSENDKELTTSATRYAVEDDTYYADLTVGPYILSASTDGTWSATDDTTGKDASAKYVGLELYNKNGTDIVDRKFYDMTEGFVKINIESAGRYYLGFLSYSDGTTSITATIKQIKVEAADDIDRPTAYVPPTGTDAYNNLDLESYVTDVSGNEHDGTIGDVSPIWITNTPIYTGGYDFNNGSSIVSSELDLTEITSSFTVSVWVKGSTAQKILTTESMSVAAPDGSTDSEWHLVTITPTAIYVDGEKKSDTTTTLEGTKLYFGKGSSGEQLWAGCLSDFRLYGTILSDQDIKNLYTNRAELDNLYQLYANEFVIGYSSKLSIEKSGVINASVFNNAEGNETDGLTAEITNFGITRKAEIYSADIMEI